MPSNTQWPWRDGLALKYYGGYLIMLGGWNPGEFGPSTNEIWISANKGTNWTLLGTAPWSARHYFGCVIKGTTLYVMGGDTYIPAKDIWTYDLTQGVLNLAVGANWTEQTSDWGGIGGDRILQTYWIYNNKIRMAGGQDGTVTPTMFTDVVELNETTWQWEKKGTLPISYASTSLIIQTPVYTYLYAGGRYLDTGHDHANMTLFKSPDGGISWETDSDLPPEFIGFMYADGVWFENRLWFLNGAGGAANPGNQSGLWSLVPGSKWVKYVKTPLARHASGVCTNYADREFFIVSGNGVNDVIKITASDI